MRSLRNRRAIDGVLAFHARFGLCDHESYKSIDVNEFDIWARENNYLQFDDACDRKSSAWHSHLHRRLCLIGDLSIAGAKLATSTSNTDKVKPFKLKYARHKIHIEACDRVTLRSDLADAIELQVVTRYEEIKDYIRTDAFAALPVDDQQRIVQHRDVIEHFAAQTALTLSLLQKDYDRLCIALRCAPRVDTDEQEGTPA